MSKMLKVNDQVYNQLDQLKVGHQTFSNVIGELLTARLKVFELINVLEGQLKYREWQQQELAKLTQSQRRLSYEVSTIYGSGDSDGRSC